MERKPLSSNCLLVATNRKSYLITIGAVFFALFIVADLMSVWIDNKINSALLRSLPFNVETGTGEKLVFQSATLPGTKLEAKHEKTLEEMTKCYNRKIEFNVAPHGNFWVLSNYVRAKKQYKCFESVTYTTQGDYTFLDNLIPLVHRWRGPVSVALHAPGVDFQPTIDSIAFLRNCNGNLIKEYVTFHILFDMTHAPTKPSGKAFDLPLWQLYEDKYDCNKGPPYANVSYKKLYKVQANLTYPINVARNVARENSQTHFVLASDIELYPSVDIINQFLKMLVNKPYIFEQEDPIVFALPVFEVPENESAPESKTELQEMVKANVTFSFHTNICKRCHAIPHLEEWLDLQAGKDLDIFTVTKRQGKYVRWEAVYIGTNDDPFFDERLDWERHGNKMSQAYALCLLNYDYMVLDNAFLVHKPGIKMKMVNAEVIPKTAKYIKNYLGVQLNIMYGRRKGCIA